jgi:predicted nuclease with TOPRIM domain
MTTGLIIEILSAEDLIRYGKPQTTLELALYEKLRERLDDVAEWYDVASNHNIDSPQELESFIEENEAEVSRLESLCDEIGLERDELQLEVDRLQDLIEELEPNQPT